MQKSTLSFYSFQLRRFVRSACSAFSAVKFFCKNLKSNQALALAAAIRVIRRRRSTFRP
jgi:hypothetical protein